MILIDSSAWIELFRGTGSAVHRSLAGLLRSDADLATTDPVSMELLAGARDRAHGRTIRAALAACTPLPVRGPGDWENAAALYLTCRRQGAVPRSLVDCLIAAVSIRTGASVLARDRDFELLAEHTQLRLSR